MPPPVELHEEVYSELSQALAWYAERNLQAAAEFLMQLEAAIARLQRWPGQGTPYVAGTRHIALKRFPYLLIYEIQAERIWVVALAHAARPPGYWRERLER